MLGLDGKIKQNALTVVAPVRSGATNDLRQALAAMGQDLGSNRDLQFRNSTSTHFARFVLVTNYGTEDRLVFTSNYDGAEADYIEELRRATSRGMDAIWQFCSPYPQGAAQQSKAWASFVKECSHKEITFFVSHPGISVSAVHRNAQMREALESILDNANGRTLELLSSLLSTSSNREGKPVGKQPQWLGRLLEWLVGIDYSPGNPNTIVSHRPVLSSLEDHAVQNALTIVAPVKENWRSRLLLRLILGIGQYTVRNAWGNLSGVTSIHFARWVLLDGGRSLLFESNYDGSWESYIDEFVDVSSAGLNGIWANCAGYPERGCRDIESFKEIIRTHQHPALVFHSAYPTLTVKNIIADHSISSALLALTDSGDVAKVLSGSYETIV